MKLRCLLLKATLMLFFFHFLFLNVSWGQGFVESAKDNFKWRLIGRAMFDAGVFYSDSTKLGNGVAISDLRIGAQMFFLENWEGRVEIGYSESKVSLKDIYIAYNTGAHTVKVGHYFEPFGVENRVGTTDYRFMTMSETDKAFGDRRKLGISYIYDKKYFTTSAGLFSDSDVDNTKNLNEGYALAGKFAGRPVYDDEKVIHLGISARFSNHDKDENKSTVYKAGASTNVLSKDAGQFIRAEVTDMINQWRWGGDVIMYYKGWYLQSECLALRVNRFGAPNYTGKGAYVQLGCLLWGNKQYKYNRQQGWVDNPDPKNLELLVRYNVTDMNDRDADIMGGKVQDVSLGVNYFFNKFIAARLNYTHAMTDRYAINGKESIDYIQARIQLKF